MNENFTVDWVIRYLQKSGHNSKRTVLNRFKNMTPNESFDLEVSLFEKRKEKLINMNKCPINKFIRERE